MASANKVQDFDVSHPTKHPKGYTVYKITFTTCPVEAPECCNTVTVWRRYSELRRLHAATATLHAKFNLPGQFPAFPKAKLLNRFEADVIEERRAASLELLQHISHHQKLVNAECFIRFLQTNEKYEDTPRKDSRNRKESQESELAAALGVNRSISLYSQLSDEDSLVDNQLHVGEPLNNSINSVNTIQMDKHDWTSGDCNTLAQIQDLSIKNGVTVNQRGTEEDDRIDLLDSGVSTESVEDCNLLKEGKVSPFIFPSSNPATSSYMKKIDSEGNSQLSRSRNGSQSSQHKNDDQSSRSSGSNTFQPYLVYQNPLHNSPQRNVSLRSDALRRFSQQSLSENDEPQSPLTPITPLTNSLPSFMPTHSRPSQDEVLRSQYVFVAAQQISQAQEHEEKQEYEAAFNMYREGVGTLLKGVQVDMNSSKREIVRKKTSQYLVRAEQLMARLTRKDKKKCGLDDLSPEIGQAEIALKSRISELLEYQVLGLTGKMMIVKSPKENKIYAMKAVAKSGVCAGHATVIPHALPHMIILHKYYETQSSIYLTLQYASGGKLWDTIGKYVTRSHWPLEMPDYGRNVYEGRRLLQEAQDSLNKSDGSKFNSSNNDVSSDQTSETIYSSPHIKEKNQHLKVPLISPSCTWTSANSNEASSNNVSESYLQLFSEYTSGIPPSPSQDLCSNYSVNGAEHKLCSEGLLGPPRVNSYSHLTDDNDQTEDNNSIGSDTLSGVSEDFSCSFSCATSTQPELDINSDVVKLVDQDSDSSKPFDIEISPLMQGDGFTGDIATTCNDESTPFETLPIPASRGDECSLSDTSVTLPSISWTVEEPADLLSLDTEDLIRSSRLLLENVNHTLEQSKKQSKPIDRLRKSGASKVMLEDGAKDKSESAKFTESLSKHSGTKDTSLVGEKCHIKVTSESCMGRHDPVRQNISSNSAVHDVVANDCRNDLVFPSEDGEKSDVVKYKECLQNVDSCKSCGNDLPSPVSEFDPPSRNCISEINERTINKKREHIINNTVKKSDKIFRKGYLLEEHKDSGSLIMLLERYTASQDPKGASGLPEGLVRAWATQIVSTIAALHKLGLVWGDFNPDNLLLGEGGSLVLTYQSQWTSVEREISDKSRKGGFVAPELDSPLSVPTPAADWWSVGAILYNLLTGQSVKEAHPAGITSHTELYTPPSLSVEASSLVTEMLRAHPNERLGGGITGALEVKDHPFFTGVLWQD
ncbi:ribosomal protein S6 kinase delta-1-like isoform X2 [Oratosquilla oratoria]|uniref:ribosomal protein S6 kinase delta-1-like isoform X2 n=1 Tax=Oratosquilla oratoria TaxID=337810 RepID=UPI003F7761C0